MDATSGAADDLRARRPPDGHCHLSFHPTSEVDEIKRKLETPEERKARIQAANDAGRDEMNRRLLAEAAESRWFSRSRPGIGR